MSNNGPDIYFTEPVCPHYSSSYDLTPEEREKVIEENKRRGTFHLLELDVNKPEPPRKSLRGRNANVHSLLDQASTPPDALDVADSLDDEVHPDDKVDG